MIDMDEATIDFDMILRFRFDYHRYVYSQVPSKRSPAH